MVIVRIRLDVFTCWMCAVVLRLIHGRTAWGSEVNVLVESQSCTATVNGRLVNLQPLDNADQPTRFTSQLTDYKGRIWNYTYSPCSAFSIPDNPTDSFGDDCLAVAVCKYGVDNKKLHYYTMGFHKTGKFLASLGKNNETNVSIVFEGYRSMALKKTYIRLVCDENRRRPGDALFKVVKDERRLGDVVAELHHLCSCPDGCPLTYLDASGNETVSENEPLEPARSEVTENLSAKPKESEEVIHTESATAKNRTKVLIIVGVNIGVILMAGLVGLMCYNKKSHLEIYHKLPGVRATPEPTLWQLASSAEALEGGNSGAIISAVSQHNGNNGHGHHHQKSGYRDGEPHTRRKSICFPVLEHCGLPEECITMGQRLGGGIFGDTYKGQWTGITVAVKRMTLSVHSYQINVEFIKSLQEAVTFLSGQRHRNIVSVLGYCSESKHPYIISEFITGQVVKDFIKHASQQLTWPHRVKILSQVADGMAYLHSTNPPILHRDLRCGNMFITNNDVVKVCDFGIVKLTQSLRSDCQKEDCACQGLYSACPPYLGWTAPEVLGHPNSMESDGHITSASDVYSYGVVMWELINGNDPYEDMHTAPEVIEHVLGGGRPEIAAYSRVLPVYVDLMKKCWKANPMERCSFKQTTVFLKEIQHQAKLFEKALNSKGARPKTRTLTFSDEVKVKEISKVTKERTHPETSKAEKS